MGQRHPHGHRTPWKSAGGPPVGFPGGLIAAQSIGERGTQLSMQSFHAGSSQFSIREVRQILAQGAWFENSEAAAFVHKMLGCNAYKSLKPRHFEVLWKAIQESPKKTVKST